MPGEVANFKKEKVCHDCGRPCKKSRCLRCLFKISTSRKIKKLQYNEKENRKYPSTEKAKKIQKKTAIKPVSDRRRSQTARYGELRKAFLLAFPTCPVSGTPTTQIHHSAHREGGWLNLRYYWIAVSSIGHRLIEDNGDWAFKNKLRVKVNGFYNHHVSVLVNDGENIDEPVFYKTWSGKLITPP